jgi:DNA-binding response OmpR family regulator
VPAKRILLIDDEWDNLECVQEFLHDEFQVTAACGGAAGIECLFNEQFDAVVLDLTMPDVDGFEVMRVIRRIVPEQPVILASAVPNLDKIAARIGAADFIAKPFRFAVLHERLRALTEAPVRARAPLAATSG